MEELAFRGKETEKCIVCKSLNSRVLSTLKEFLWSGEIIHECKECGARFDSRRKVGKI